MLDKFKGAVRKKLFPCEPILKAILDEHATALDNLRQARERLQNASQQGIVRQHAIAKAQGHR